MEFKLNIPLIGKIGALFSKAEAVQKPDKPARHETTETSSNSAAYYYEQMKIERTRKAQYADYRAMDADYVECSAALDIYADNATKERSDKGEIIEVTSTVPKVKNILEELYDRIHLQDILWDTARNIAKMGDDWDEVIAKEDKLIVRLKGLEAETMSLELDEYGVWTEKPYVQKDLSTGAKIADFYPWQIIHWKNGGIKRMYGESILRSIRRLYKQLQMMEDGMVVGRLSRSHMRYKFTINTEGMNPEDAEDHIEKVKERNKKKRLINPISGQLETQQNPLSAQEDFFLDDKSDVATLEGATNLGNIRDVLYFQDKFFIGLIPKIYLGLGAADPKANVIEQVVQFACRVSRLRKGLRQGIIKLSDRQLILSGEMPRKGLYEVHFAPISMVDEMRKWTTERLKAEVAKIYRADLSLLSDEYILKHFVGVPEEEIAVLLKAPKTEVSKSLAKGNGNLALRASGSTGVTAPGATGMTAKKAAEQEDGNGFHIPMLGLYNLVETLNDLVSLELNR